MTRRKALVAVMGDLARSPRMQNHCLSLANINFDVTVLSSGYGRPDRANDELEDNPNIHQVYCDELIDFKKHLPSIIAFLLKPIWQSLLLIYLLVVRIPLTHVIIIQNPPSVPLIPLLYFYSRIFRIRMIMDWHNYGYSILAMNLGQRHPFVRLYRFIEFSFGRRADAGFCVSEAMRADLCDNFYITYPIKVLYDKPPKQFRPLSLQEKHRFFTKMKLEFPSFRSGGADEETRFTQPNNGTSWKSDRPAIIITSTSWTEDEAFDILLETLERYNKAMNLQPERLPKLFCVITGKGPMKQAYEKKIREADWKNVEVVMPWLSSSDYAKMVASSDLGICLHTSSSGVDLPMKVVDMFGCGVPVLAYNFKAIAELVAEDIYGLTFDSSEECFEKLRDLMISFKRGHGCPLSRYEMNIKNEFSQCRWEDNWNSEARPLIEQMTLQRGLINN